MSILLYFNFSSKKKSNFQCLRSQIGTNNCTARYRTLSGGVGESPSLSPSPSSDYENDLAASHGLPMGKIKRNGGCGGGGGGGGTGAIGGGIGLGNGGSMVGGGGGLVGVGGMGSGMHKGSSIITQKATVHHVSVFIVTLNALILTECDKFVHFCVYFYFKNVIVKKYYNLWFRINTNDQ